MFSGNSDAQSQLLRNVNFGVSFVEVRGLPLTKFTSTSTAIWADADGTHASSTVWQCPAPRAEVSGDRPVMRRRWRLRHNAMHRHRTNRRHRVQALRKSSPRGSPFRRARLAHGLDRAIRVPIAQENEGSGSYVAVPEDSPTCSITLADDTLAGQTARILTGDLDGDGDLDVLQIYPSRYSSSIVVHRNDGGGAFTRVSTDNLAMVRPWLLDLTVNYESGMLGDCACRRTALGMRVLTQRVTHTRTHA